MLAQCVTSLQRERDAEPQGLLSISTGPRLDTSTLLEVCGDFEKTIRECEKLLRENIGYGQQRGRFTPLTNIKWNIAIKSEVVRFSNRLAFHNQKV